MEDNAVVFDAARPIAINLRTPDGLKTIRVRFPSDAEWSERQRRRKVIIKQLGRGVSETSISNSEEVEATLLAKIRSEQEPPVDAFEAARVIEQLATAEVEDVVPVSDGYRILTRVLGGTTVHLLKMPTAKDVFSYRRSFARLLDLPFGKQELTINVNVAASLYDSLVQATEGYAGAGANAVPVVHKAVAVKAAIDALDAAFNEDERADF